MTLLIPSRLRAAWLARLGLRLIWLYRRLLLVAYVVFFGLLIVRRDGLATMYRLMVICVRTLSLLRWCRFRLRQM